MSLADCLDLGASLVPTAPCLMTDDTTLSYAETQGLSRSVAASLRAIHVGPGDTIGVLSSIDPLALTCVFGASRAGAAWILVDPTETTAAAATEELAACSVVLFRTAQSGLVRALQPRLGRLHTLVCLDGEADGALGWGQFLTAGFTGATTVPAPPAATSPQDAAEDRPVLLARHPVSTETAEHWRPVLARGGRIMMRARDHWHPAALLRA